MRIVVLFIVFSFVSGAGVVHKTVNFTADFYRGERLLFGKIMRVSDEERELLHDVVRGDLSSDIASMCNPPGHNTHFGENYAALVNITRLSNRSEEIWGRRFALRLTAEETSRGATCVPLLSIVGTITESLVSLTPLCAQCDCSAKVPGPRVPPTLASSVPLTGLSYVRSAIVLLVVVSVLMTQVSNRRSTWLGGHLDTLIDTVKCWISGWLPEHKRRQTTAAHNEQARCLDVEKGALLPGDVESAAPVSNAATEENAHMEANGVAVQESVAATRRAVDLIWSGRCWIKGHSDTMTSTTCFSLSRSLSEQTPGMARDSDDLLSAYRGVFTELHLGRRLH